MDATNRSMTVAAVEQLQLTDQQRVLEIGPGNAGHLAHVLGQAKDLAYWGLEISETMQAEAQRINADLIAEQSVTFQRYDGQQLPFPDAHFDRVMTVNTLYFWTNPVAFLGEIYRVLRPGGYAVICYAQKSFMERLPFVRDKFTLYDNAAVRQLVERAGGRILDLSDRSETVRSKAGDQVQRDFSLAKTQPK